MSITFILSTAYMWWAKVPDFPLGAPSVRGWLILRALFGFGGLFCLYCTFHNLPSIKEIQDLQSLRLCTLPSPSRSDCVSLPRPHCYSLRLLRGPRHLLHTERVPCRSDRLSWRDVHCTPFEHLWLSRRQHRHQ